jgi:hypothetical protein
LASATDFIAKNVQITVLAGYLGAQHFEHTRQSVRNRNEPALPRLPGASLLRGDMQRPFLEIDVLPFQRLKIRPNAQAIRERQ